MKERWSRGVLPPLVPPPVLVAVLRGIEMVTVPRFDVEGGCDPWFDVLVNGWSVVKTKHINPVLHLSGEGTHFFDCGGRVLEGDVRVDVYDQDKVVHDDHM